MSSHVTQGCTNLGLIGVRNCVLSVAFGAGLLSFRLTGLALLVVTLVTKDMAHEAVVESNASRLNSRSNLNQLARVAEKLRQCWC